MNRKRRTVCRRLLFTLIMTAVLRPAPATADPPAISFEDFPVIDGSLACVPLMEQLIMKVTGCSEAQADQLLNNFSNTNPCYLNLAAGQRQLCLAYEPAAETIEELEQFPALEMTPVGRDALVFIVNEDNPVEGLTSEQITAIYTGEITSWKDVGGEDHPVKVFTRPEKSGSQTLMRKLLIGDKAMAEGRYYKNIPGMEGMLRVLGDEYDNAKYAIGYSVFFYVSDMMGMQGVKCLEVDGVLPTTETIRSGEYPLVNDFYIVTGSASGDAAVELKNWLLSDEGQCFVEECGYVPVR